MGHTTHLCVILVKVDKVTRIATSLANNVSRSSASTNTEIMAEFALHSICVIVIGTSGHTLSAIVADSTGTSLVMDNPEVATCLALKWALCTQWSQHSQSTSTDDQADTWTDGHRDTQIPTCTYLITAPNTLIMALLTLFSVVVRIGLTAGG